MLIVTLIILLYMSVHITELKTTFVQVYFLQSNLLKNTQVVKPQCTNTCA